MGGTWVSLKNAYYDKQQSYVCVIYFQVFANEEDCHNQLCPIKWELK